MRVAQRVVGARQQHGHGACGLHGGNATLRQMLDVVARQRAVAGRQRRAAHVRQLLGMQLDGDAELLRRPEDLLGLGQREGDALAEHIHRIHQPFGGQRGQHVVADEVDVVLAAPCVFGRQGVRAQKSGAHRHPKHLAQAARHAQLLAFVLQRQAVAGFDLDGAHALGQQGLQARHGLGKKLVFRRRTRGLDRRHNAPARLGHFFVRGTGQAHGEFVGTLAAVDQMGVAIDQARRDQGARALPVRQVLPSGWH